MMVSVEDAPFTYEYQDHFKILPAINNWSSSPARIKDGVRVSEDFSYSSDTNPDWMQPAELRTWIDAHSSKMGAI
jgi:hypothetical protein